MVAPRTDRPAAPKKKINATPLMTKMWRLSRFPPIFLTLIQTIIRKDIVISPQNAESRPINCRIRFVIVKELLYGGIFLLFAIERMFSK